MATIRTLTSSSSSPSTMMRRRVVVGGSLEEPTTHTWTSAPKHHPDDSFHPALKCHLHSYGKGHRLCSPPRLSSSVSSASSPGRRRTAAFLCLPTLILGCLVLWLLAAKQSVFFVSHYKERQTNKNDAASSTTTTSSSYYPIEEIERVLQETQGATTWPDNKFVVFVTISNTNETSIQMGQSATSTLEAFQGAMAEHDKKERLNNNNDSYKWLKIDVVNRIESLQEFDFSVPLQTQVGGSRRFFYGLALDWATGWAFLPEEVWANNLVDGPNDLVRWDNMVAYVLQKQSNQEKNIMGWAPFLLNGNRNVEASTSKHGLELFSTKSYFVDLASSDSSSPLDTPTQQPHGSNAIIPVYHGHRLFEKDDISPSLLIHAARAAGDYLIRSVKDIGKMVYIFNPRTDQESDTYNLTRHAGTMYAMACLYHHTKDPALLAKMRLAMHWLLKEHLEKCRLPYKRDDERLTTRRCIVEETVDVQGRKSKATKLGVNALTLLAISELLAATHEEKSLGDDAKFFVDVAHDLADYIQSAQHDDGSFVQKIQYYPTFELDEAFFVRYYQGEATFALSRFYYVTGSVMGLEPKQEWLDVAQAAAGYIIEMNWYVPDEEFVDDHWLLYGLAELHRCDSRRVSSRFVEFAMRTVHLVGQSQYKEEDEDRGFSRLDLNDWVGIYHESTSATSTATKSEGLCAIYELAEDHRLEKEMAIILDSATDSVRYQLKAQYGPELAMYMRDPLWAIGGLRQGIDSLLMRNDFTQHNLSSFLCLSKILQKRHKDRFRK